MRDYIDFSKELDKSIKLLNTKKTKRDMVLEEIDRLNLELDKEQSEKMINEKISLLLNETTKKVRKKVTKSLENIATLALRQITDEDNSRIKIDLTEKGKKPSAEINIEKEINGEVSVQSIIDANGGGYADISSTTLRQIFLEEIKEPIIQGALFLDEPGKMVDQTSSMEYARFLQQLSMDFNRQNIIVTHDPNIMFLVDKSYHITQDNNGISSAELIESEDAAINIINEMEEGKDE